MFCSQCGAESTVATRFCAQCGAPLATAQETAAASAQPEPVREAVPVPQQPAKSRGRRRGCGCLGGCLGLLALLVVLVALAAGAGAYYYYGPDLPPLGGYIPSWDDISSGLPFSGDSKPLPPMDPDAKRQIEANRARLAAPRQAETKREEQVLNQLQSTGLPVTGVYIMPTDAGQPVLAVAVSFEKISGGTIGGTGMGEGVDALVRLAQTKDLDLSGLSYTTMAVRDNQGRTLLGVTASVDDIERFRQGQIDRREFIKRTAAKVESRAGLLDAVGGMIKQ